jgi:hypothetical protein
MSQANHQDGAWYQIVNPFTNTVGKGFFLFSFSFGSPNNFSFTKLEFFCGKKTPYFPIFWSKNSKIDQFQHNKKIIWADLVGNGNME